MGIPYLCIWLLSRAPTWCPPSTVLAKLLQNSLCHSTSSTACYSCLPRAACPYTSPRVYRGIRGSLLSPYDLKITLLSTKYTRTIASRSGCRSLGTWRLLVSVDSRAYHRQSRARNETALEAVCQSSEVRSTSLTTLGTTSSS